MYGMVINRLYAIDAYMRHTTFSLWCCFRQCPCDLGSVPARKGGTVGDGQVYMAGSGLSCRNPLVGIGWAISLLLCTNGLRKQSSDHVGPPFLAVKPIFLLCKGDHWPRAVTCKLVRQWVWFESWMCTGWLQWHLCQVRSFKTHLKWKYV